MSHNQYEADRGAVSFDVARADKVIVGAASSDSQVEIQGTSHGILCRSVPAGVTLADGDDTLTIAELFSGYIQNTAGLGDDTFTTPTAAEICAALYEPSVGTSFEVTLINVDSDNTLTLANGTDCTPRGNGVVNASSSGRFLFRVTGAGASPTVDYIRLA